MSVYILGGFQTDFARHFTREKKDIAALIAETVQGAFAATNVEPGDVGSAHVANFCGELFCQQANLGGLVIEAEPKLEGIATARHEGACAAGSLAIIAGSTDIESGRYDCSLVVGIEILRSIPAIEAQHKLGVAAWNPRETEGVKYPWPDLFAKIGDAYDARWGLKREHQVWLAKNAFANAKKSPKAQTRGWSFDDRSFAMDQEVNPELVGRIRRQDCSQVTDGGTALFLASEAFARKYADKRGLQLSDLAKIEGWGHRTARMGLAEKLEAGKKTEYLFPHIRGTVTDALGRAKTRIEDVDVIETHDCFTTTAYMAIDHFGLTAPGESWRAIEDGSLALGGKKPMNPTGGLIGTGHPVGATGVRMALDAYNQVTGKAAEAQVPNAKRVATLNLGGSATTSVSFVIGRG
jgi:acetyl-CoA C-acetyltransferase